MTEQEAVDTAKELLAEGVEPQSVTHLLVRLDKEIKGRRTVYNPRWWTSRIASTSRHSSTPWSI